VAQALKASRTTVDQWQAVVESEGLDGLKRQGQSGRTPKLDERQIEKLKAILKAGAACYGFPNEQWTGKRIRRVILETFQIEYNANYLSRLLRRLGYSPQLPQTQSKKRSQQAVDHWKRTVWTHIKKIH
jgi:transposase